MRLGKLRTWIYENKKRQKWSISKKNPWSWWDNRGLERRRKNHNWRKDFENGRRFWRSERCTETNGTGGPGTLDGHEIGVHEQQHSRHWQDFFLMFQWPPCHRWNVNSAVEATGCVKLSNRARAGSTTNPGPWPTTGCFVLGLTHAKMWKYLVKENN